MKKSKKDKHFVHRAYYEGGQDALKAFLKDQLVYPAIAVKNRIQGDVKLRFEVDFKGNVHRVKVIAGIGYGCDEEAVRIAKLLVYKVPKTYKLKVGFKKKLNVHFRLKEEKVVKNLQPEMRKSINYNYSITQTPKVGTKKKQSSYSYSIKMRDNRQ